MARHWRPVIIGAGLAGLMTALHLSPEPVMVLSKAPLGTEASSAWAQGGIAAAVGRDDDPAQHLADTLRAGDGLYDPAVVSRIVSAGPATIEHLIQLGVRFDRAAMARCVSAARRRTGGDASCIPRAMAAGGESCA